MEKERAQFIKDPYRFTKSLLGEAKSGKLMSPNEEVQELIEKTFSDPSRTIPFEEGQELGLAGKPATDLSTNKPRSGGTCKIKICQSSQWYTLQSIQKVLQTMTEILKTHPEELHKRHHSNKQSRCLFWLLPHKSVQDYFPSKCRRQDLFLSAGEENDTVHD